jgi:hypothetical protein
MTTVSLMGTAAILLLSVSSAYATSTSASTSVATASDKTAERLQKIIATADLDISARVDTLQALSARVLDMKNVSADQKTALRNVFDTNVSGLNDLKTKIHTDTDLATATTDAKSIFTTFRIYALVIPQGWILATADRVATIADLMATFATQIQTRITADQAAGKDVSLLNATLTDMSTKIADAHTQSASVLSSVSGLLPDEGATAKITSNHAALVAARAVLKKAAADLVDARKDMVTLTENLHFLEGTPSATSTVSSATH